MIKDQSGTEPRSHVLAVSSCSMNRMLHRTERYIGRCHEELIWRGPPPVRPSCRAQSRVFRTSGGDHDLLMTDLLMGTGQIWQARVYFGPRGRDFVVVSFFEGETDGLETNEPQGAPKGRRSVG